MRPVSAMVLLLTLSLGIGGAEPSRLHFAMGDGSEFVGSVVEAGPDAIVVSSELFREPMSVQTVSHFRAERGQDLLNLDDGAFSFELRDQSRFVGRPISVEAGRLRVSTVSLGEVEFAIDRLIRVARAGAMELRTNSLAQTQHLWRGKDWLFRDGRLFTVEGPRREQDPSFRAVVGELDLRARFHLRLELSCDGVPSVQVLLGDRAEDGGGQGRGRRGSSRSLSPEKERLTQIEWFEGGVSLTRRTSSIAEMVLFDLGSPERFELDLYLDQQRGQVAAYQAGQLLGKVELPEQTPAIHSTLTLISRGDAVVVNSLELFEWSGQLPDSRSIKPPFTEMMDGTVRGVAEINEDTDWQAMKRMNWPGAFQAYPSPCLEFLWPDGCRVAGEFVEEAESGHQAIRTLGGEKFATHLESLSRLIRVDGAPLRPGGAELRRGEQRVFGELATANGALAWQADFLNGPAPLSMNAKAEVLWHRDTHRSQGAIVFDDGQRASGTLQSVAEGCGFISTEHEWNSRSATRAGITNRYSCHADSS